MAKYAPLTTEGATHWLTCTASLGVGGPTGPMSNSNLASVIEAGSTLDGIVAEAKVASSLTTPALQDYAFRLVLNGTIQSTDRSNPTPWPTSGVGNEAYRTHGGATDTWGGLTMTDLFTGSFGSALVAKNLHPTSASTGYVNAMRWTIYYTLPLLRGMEAYAHQATTASQCYTTGPNCLQGQCRTFGGGGPLASCYADYGAGKSTNETWDRFYHSMYFAYDGPPPAAKGILELQQMSDEAIRVDLNPDGTLTLHHANYPYEGATCSMSTVTAANTIYRLVLWADKPSNQAGVKLYSVGGNLIEAGTCANIGVTGQILQAAAGNGWTGDVIPKLYVDEHYSQAMVEPGHWRIASAMPTGTVWDQWSRNGSCVTSWECVDELPLDGDASYVASAMLTQQRVDWTHAAYATLAPALQSPPLAVAQAAYCKGSSGQPAWMGMNGDWLATLACSSSYYLQRYVLAAQTNHQPWTEAAFNSLQQNLQVPTTPTPNATPRRVSVFWTGVLGPQATHTLTATPTNTPAPPTESPTPEPTFTHTKTWTPTITKTATPGFTPSITPTDPGGGGAGGDDDALLHYHYDHLGSVQVITKRAGNVYQYIRYKAYGEIRGRWLGNLTSADDCDVDGYCRSFTGYDHEPISDLQYAGARVYDPQLATFLTHDPVRQFASPYTYTNWNPTNLTDPNGACVLLGLDCLTVALLVVAATVVATAIDTGLKTGSVGAAFKAGAIAGAVGLAGVGLGIVVAPAFQALPEIVQYAVVLGSGAYGTYQAVDNGYYGTAIVGAFPTLLAAYGIAKGPNGEEIGSGNGAAQGPNRALQGTAGQVRYVSAQGADDGPVLQSPIEGEGLTTNGQFGPRPTIGDPNRMHQGIDIRAKVGTPVKAAADGRVVLATRLAGYDNVVHINHADLTLQTRYAHLSDFAPGIKPGVDVQGGQLIGHSGFGGNAAHLHFEVRTIVNFASQAIPNAYSIPANPLDYLSTYSSRRGI